MSADLQMARSTGEGETNLAVGEPFFLQQELHGYMRVAQIKYPVTYPLVGGEPELLEELHRHYPEYKHIVVTGGAKQAIEAAFFGFKTVERRSIVSHQAPYWPSYPTLARSQGLDFNVRGPRSANILCVTSPNNPDGAQSMDPAQEFDLWDAAYAQPLYGYYGIAPKHRVAVFSAAKLLGLSGLRVGWLATNDDDLANAARYFVEITTSGVAIPSQMHLTGCLKALRDPNQITVLTAASFRARAALMANGASFTEILSDLVEEVRGVPACGEGMFAWFLPMKPWGFQRALTDAKVKIVTGEACGGQEGWIRMSMGHNPEITRAALIRIRDEYYHGWVSQ